jgi:hypothetical protein
MLATATREELVAQLQHAIGTMRILKANLDHSNILLKARIESAAKPLVILGGDYSQEEVNQCVQLLRNIGCGAIVLHLAPGNTLVTMDDRDLQNIGLTRLGMGHA